MSDLARQVVASSRRAAPPVEEPEAPARLFLPTGSTLLNLCLSDHPLRGMANGKMMNIIGDSHAGKTFLALNMMAEACRMPEFNDYRLILDDAESALEIDIPRLFGSKLADRLQAPRYDGDEIVPSDTIEDFQLNIHRALDEGSPFIYVLDSFDAISSEAEEAKTKEQNEAREKALEKGTAVEPVTGSYGMEKAKQASSLFRQIMRRLKSTNSFLVVLSQTRDKIDKFSFEKKTRAGGRALKFYSSYEMWLAVGQKIRNKQYDRAIGIYCEGKVTKNRINGKYQEFSFGIYPSYGIDDINSCIDALLECKYWTMKGAYILPTGLYDGQTFLRQQLIKIIERDRDEQKLSMLVGKVWKEIEAKIALQRRPRYE